MSGIKVLNENITTALEAGDLIEIFRVGYQHWAIYVGNGYVIHLAPPSEVAFAGASSMQSVFCERALVKKDKLSDVVGRDKYKVNNLLDEKYEPRDVYLIVKEAHSLVGQTLPYCLFSSNCEHFVTDLRYGKAESRQVRNAAIGAAVAIGAVGVMAVVASVLFSEKKEKKNKY